MNKDQQIAYQVSFKAAVELTSSGVAEPETDDIAAEIAALADSLYDQLSERLGDSGKSATRSSGHSTTSKRRVSHGGGKSSGGKFKFASDKQHALIEKLLEEKAHDIEFGEDSFSWDGAEIEFGKVPSGKTQEIIGYLLDFDDA